MGCTKIPLTSAPSQSFKCTIPVDGKNITLKLNVRFNTAANYWVMSISDPKTEKYILDGIPLLTGTDILGQYAYLGLGSASILNIGNNTMDSPDSTNLGTDFILVWSDSV
ncbi:MAG TPA: hypothetical protein VN456_07650 [Desulfosporosinus sp.]|nr:hypothetical protein [Desulfosporosinus sp.]